MDLPRGTGDSFEDVIWFNTHCSRMDHGGCALRVGVRGSRVVEIRPDPDGILSRGHLCTKGITSAEKLYHPNHLKLPLRCIGKRGSEQWEEISWSEALDTIAWQLKRIRYQHGARSVVFCQRLKGVPCRIEKV